MPLNDEGQEEGKQPRKIHNGQQTCQDVGPHSLGKQGKCNRIHRVLTPRMTEMEEPDRPLVCKGWGKRLTYPGGGEGANSGRAAGQHLLLGASHGHV